MYIYIHTADTSGVNRLASQICHNRLFHKKLQQNLLHMISTEASSLAAHNMRRYFLTSRRVALLATLELIDSALLHQFNLLLRWKLHRIVVGRPDIRLCKEAGHLAMRFVLAACYAPYSPSRHEVCPAVELANHVLDAVREHGHLECSALQLVYNMTRKSGVCRERIVNVCDVKMVRQNRELVMT
jgi:hypothetical protein